MVTLGTLSLCHGTPPNFFHVLTIALLNLYMDTQSYLHFISFIGIAVGQVVEIRHLGEKGYASNIINSMGADVLATLGASASAADALT